MPPSRTDLPVGPGDVIDGKYRVESIVGVGGMGFVVAATHVELSQPVAIKFLLPDFAGNPEAVARFQREAQSAARIRNDHVARVFDIGRMSGVGPFLVMEYLVGSDLAAELQAWKALSVQDAVDLLMQACEGTAEAHALGIVHRDLKPANLFIVRGRGGEPVVKLLDFGISKTLPTEGQAPVDLTSTTSVMGSPSYMSPEQIRSSKLVDHRTDVWALGVILFEMLTGGTPFEADSVQGMCAAIAADSVRSPRALRSEIPEELAAVVMRCLEKDAARRVQSVAELATAIAPFGSDAARRGAQRILRISAEGASTMLLNSPQIREFGPPTASAWSSASPTAHRRSRAVFVFAGIAIAAVVIGGALAVRGSGKNEVVAAASNDSASVASAPAPTLSAPTVASSDPAASVAPAASVVASSAPVRVNAPPAKSPPVKSPPREGAKPAKGGPVVDPLAEP